MGREITLPIKVREVARGTGLSASQVSRIFSRQSIPSLQAAVLIARHYKVTIEYLATYLNVCT